MGEYLGALACFVIRSCEESLPTETVVRNLRFDNPRFPPRGHQANQWVESAEGSPVAMKRPIQAKTNKVSPPSHAPRLNVPENQCAIP